MSRPLYPSLYQINTRVWLTELSRALNRPATLDDIPDADLDRLAEMGFDWIWFLSVWRTGLTGQRISRENREWRREFEETLPDLREEDIAGSGFAITEYTVDPQLGGDDALLRLRERLKTRGFSLMLDFVPNHTALDHPWVEQKPSFYVSGTEVDLAQAPQNYTRVRRKEGDLLLAHGRDPFFPGWPDTLQLDYGNPATQEAMIGELLKIAGQCDGVRCDMAMLVLPEVFERTWMRRAPSFWPQAIARVRERFPGFLLMAEVYWDLEWTMTQQGFDYAYDKRLYDRLREGHARPVREHFQAGLDYHGKLARFLENHDEPRASAVFAPDMGEAAAIITYLSPGLRLFFIRASSRDGGSGSLRISSERHWNPPTKTRGSSTKLCCTFFATRSCETVIGDCWTVFRRGTEIGPPTASSPGPGRVQTPSGGLSWSTMRQTVVNYAPNNSQCYTKLALPDLSGRAVRLRDLTGPAIYDRDGSDLAMRGLYLDLPPWAYHVFEITVQ